MKKSIISLIFMIIGLSIYGQNQSDSIYIKRDAMGVFHYFHNSKEIKLKNVAYKLQDNTEAYKKIHSAQINSLFSQLFKTVGLGMIFYQSFKYILNDNPNWDMAGYGVGVFALSVPFSIISHKKARRGIGIYNSQLNNKPEQPTTQLRFGATENGIGIKVIF